MRIRLWNAFASNNSGSYTIVGTFRDPPVAAAVAAELRALCDAESAWQRAQWSPATQGGEQPLVTFARQTGIPHDERDRDDDDWPDLAYAPPPSVTHTTHQVVLHAPYTVSMPRLFGQVIYHRGGRVDAELDHAHEPLVVDHEVFARWEPKSRAGRLEAAFAALTATDSPVHRHSLEHAPPIVRFDREPWPRIRMLAVYEDLVTAVTEVDAVVRAHELELRVRLREAEPGGEPLRAWRQK